MLESSKVPTLTRAIDILNLIARIGPCSITATIDTLGIPKSTVYLLSSKFRYQRFLNPDRQENSCLWARLVELSGHMLNKMDLRELVRSCLMQLIDITGLSHRLGIIDGDSTYYISEVESSATISVRSNEGKSLSLCRSEIGKCLLAWQPVAVQKSIIEELVWEQMTPTTTTHPQRLYEELARIRRQGWGYDNGEDYADVRCVVAPVFNANSELTAVISVAGTRLQTNEEYRDYLADKVIAYARGISCLLRWKSPLDLQTS